MLYGDYESRDSERDMFDAKRRIRLHITGQAVRLNCRMGQG